MMFALTVQPSTFSLRTGARMHANSCALMCATRKVSQSSVPDVAAAAADIESKFASLFNAPPATFDDESTGALAHIAERDSLVGQISSSEMLRRDEQFETWPEANLAKGDADTTQNMLWVDELSCIGCTWCADVARSTFRMANEEHEFGTARVVQQGGDVPETVEEAIACCPADCIHWCTRSELELLEEHRGLGHLHDLQAKFQTRRLVSQGDGGGSVAAPYWRDPITHQGWRKGDKYVRSRRLSLVDPLINRGDV